MTLAYAFVLGEWQDTRQREATLLYEREFLRYLSTDIELAESARILDKDLYLDMLDASSHRYNYKPEARRLDRAIKDKASVNYLGRVTSGIMLDELRYNILADGIEIIYRINGSEERSRYYRFNGL